MPRAAPSLKIYNLWQFSILFYFPLLSNSGYWWLNTVIVTLLGDQYELLELSTGSRCYSAPQKTLHHRILLIRCFIQAAIYLLHFLWAYSTHQQDSKHFSGAKTQATFCFLRPRLRTFLQQHLPQSAGLDVPKTLITLFLPQAEIKTHGNNNNQSLSLLQPSCNTTTIGNSDTLAWCRGPTHRVNDGSWF